ncbi:SDR family oxidoreductase [Pseudomonas aeruginosa]|uniref:SDR family oxidoreductase n=1 Tax=Pseudomonas aeruginosa TaxID=287 RepID=UPI001B4BD68F|nr:SDR family oxidoreductase [Pseudoxanthomonas sp.]
MRSIFITGAAAGIGREVALRFAAAGWFVGLYDVDETAVRALAGALGARSHAARLDVSRIEDWHAALEAFAPAAQGRLDLLFNNAGIAIAEAFEDSAVERHCRVIDVNLRGVLNGCHAALPLLRATPGARIVNMCSASALYGQPLLATYSATKAAVRSLTEALDIEWQRHGVRVVDVLPLFVNTAMVADEVSKMKTVQTLGVRLRAEDVARVVWRLAQGRPQRLPVHNAVGWQTWLFYVLGKRVPDALNRLVTARMGGF